MANPIATVKVTSALLALILLLLLPNPLVAALSCTDPWGCGTLADPSPPVKAWTESIAYHDQHLIYAGSDNSIYAFNLAGGKSSLVCDLADDPGFIYGPTGFMVSADGYLYFHDNGNTTRIYRLLLSEPWPAHYESFDTQCNSAIFAFAQNPWTDGIWFASADFYGGGDNMYLYRVDGFGSVTQKASLTKRPFGGNGPIIFQGENALLYGESVWGGDGYFHLVDSTTGTVSEADYLTFTGGLAAATYGYNGAIYVTSGDGRGIYEIKGSETKLLVTAEHAAQGMVFDGTSLFVSERKVNEDYTTTVRFNALWPREASPGGNLSGMVNTATEILGYKAGIQGATVTLSRDTSIAASATTNRDGNYAFTEVPVGIYTLKVEAVGFKSVSLGNGVYIGSGDHPNLVISLEQQRFPGDVNGDKQVGLEDAIYILQVLAGIRGSEEP